MSLYSWFTRNGPTGFGYTSTAWDVTEGLDLTGATFLVTGCNSGLGRETCRVLALRGGRVIGLARNETKARAALADLHGEHHVALACDLSEPESVRRAIGGVQDLGAPLDAIIANAGIMALPQLQQAHGYELQFFTNHVGHAQLVTGLESQLVDTGRVVMLSSQAHLQAPRRGIEFDNLSGERRYGPWLAYGQSKLANLLFARELARRFAGTARTANAVHPGVISTNLGRHLPSFTGPAFAVAKPLFLKSVAQGAATQVYVAAHPDAGGVSGEYWRDCNVVRSGTKGRDSTLASELWQRTEQILAKLP